MHAIEDTVALPDIRLSAIRPLDGSQHTAFEELCCQLATAEPFGEGCEFVRKGRGADGGVECLWRRPDGSEHGWQAKYVWGWDDSLAAQLNDSIKTALRLHPALTHYTVCLPFDLPDGRRARAKSARRKWDDWRAGWIQKALESGRKLTVDLWGQSELIARLTNSPERQGQVLYWFEQYGFSDRFFQDSFYAARSSLGSRYTPETNVALPIRRDFLALARDSFLQDEAAQWFVRVGNAGSKAAREIEGLGCEDGGIATRLRHSVGAAIDVLQRLPQSPKEPYPVIAWAAAVEACRSNAREAITWLYALEIPASKAKSKSFPHADPRSLAIHDVVGLIDMLDDVRNALASRRWALAIQKAVLLTGHAGSGKSHLLADVVAHQVERGLPAILIPSHHLHDAEPWHQILQELHRPPSEDIRHFLGALDAAAQARGCRALVCIDALNEGQGLKFWRGRLAKFLAAAEPYAHVAIVVSCRTTYLPYVVPEDLVDTTLYPVSHAGFGDDESGAAAHAYLAARGVVRPGAPNLLPEFNNPLFLKTCCDLLDRQGKRVFPRGLRGITAIFNFYLSAVTHSINLRLGLDPHAELIPKAIAAFIDRVCETGVSSIDESDAHALFETIRPANGVLEHSLLPQLVFEGLFSVEPVMQNDEAVVEQVRFTFERFSDYAVAQRALEQWLDTGDVAASFASGTPLRELAFGDDHYLRAGVVEALSVLLPERTGHELIDLAPRTSYELGVSFRESLLWRAQEHFSARTHAVLADLWPREVVTDVLISISTEPDNRYNARFIDAKLRAMTMPDRDADWSVDIAAHGFEGALQTLITWSATAPEHLIEPERAELAATTLTWCLSTTHRTVRDRATKALAALLSGRLELAAHLLGRFRDVDDPYIVERLLAAIYGAALQGASDQLGVLVEAVDRLVFARMPVFVDVLARDHALGILEYANSRGALPDGFDLHARRPPYSSDWPIELVSDEVIGTYVEKNARGSFDDSIVSSTINDGDFARYIMDRRVDDWSPAARGIEQLPTTAEVYRAWQEAFLRSATTAQRTALDTLLAAGDAVASQAPYAQNVETDAWTSARTTFRSTLLPEEWEAFRISAENFIRFGRRDKWARGRIATFDTHWARRWVCKRAHDLGWTSERFSDFERSFIKYGRNEHQIERIGKKYQWIAFRELLARMADNLAFIGSFRGHDERRPIEFEGAQQVDVRDIDPSLLLTGTYYDDWKKWPATWWSPIPTQLRAASLKSRLAWLDAGDDILSGHGLIDVTDPKTGRQWLVLSAFTRLWGQGLIQGERESQRSTWYRLRCVVVPRPDFAKLQKAFSSSTMVDPDSFERLHLGHDVYLGEFPWHPVLADEASWSSRGPRHSGPASARPTTVEYRCEATGYDQSLDHTVVLELPAPWLAKALSLRMASGRTPHFLDANGDVQFFDPSVSQPGPGAALVDRRAFFDMLERDDLAALWVIAGEKDVSAGAMHRQELVGCLSHTQAFWYDGDWQSTKRHEEWYRVNIEELEAHLAMAQAAGDSDR